MRQEIKTERRQVIVDAATNLFLKYGYKKTSLEEVAEIAGVGKATLYHYFKGKSSLFGAVIKNLFQQYLDALVETLARHKTATDKLSSYGELLLAQHRRLSQPLFELVKSDSELPVQIHSNLKEMGKKEQEIMESILHQGVETQEFVPMDIHRTASLVLGSFRAMIIHARKNEGSENEIVDDFLKIIFNGILHKKEEQ